MTDLLTLDIQKSKLLDDVAGWSAERLAYRASPGCWSVAQVFDHLVKTEERILEAARRGTAKHHRIGLSDRARTLFLRKIFETDRRVKVPDSATMVLPDGAPEMTAVCERWKDVRTDLDAFHRELSSAQLRQGIFRHPVGGWMALPDVMDFFFVHMQHHAYQLDRLSAESKSL